MNKKELMKENAALLEVVEFLAKKAEIRDNYEDDIGWDFDSSWNIPWWLGLLGDIRVLKARKADTERNDLADKRTGGF